MAITPTAAVVAELAPTGVLRAGINLSNFLLVRGRAANGDPQGIAPDMAGEIAKRLNVPLKLIPYESPGKLADAVADWDVGLIGAEPARAGQITFSAAYLEIEATYLVPAGSNIRSVDEVDHEGVRIAVAERVRSVSHAQHPARQARACGRARRIVRVVCTRKARCAGRAASASCE